MSAKTPNPLAVIEQAANRAADDASESGMPEDAKRSDELAAARAAVAELVDSIKVIIPESRILPVEDQADWLRRQLRAALAKFAPEPSE